MGKHLLIYEATAVIFALTVILLTMKFRVTNRVLAYAGEHLFSLFILQRIPMMLLKQTAVYRTEWLYFVLCLIMTAALSWAFDELFGRLWKALLVGKKREKSAARSQRTVTDA